MKLQLITFEQAKALKEFGFPQLENLQIWCKDKDKIDLIDFTLMVNLFKMKGWKPEEAYVAPSLELVAKWLREEKGLIVEVNYTYDDTYHWDVIQRKQPSKMKQYGVIPLTDNRTYQNTYEEALSGGIDKAIEILKEK